MPWSSSGVWDGVSNTFSVPLFWSASEKGVFTNHVPRLCLQSEFDRTNRISRLKMDPLAYKLSRLSKSQGSLSIAYLFCDRFTGHVIVVKQTVQFSVLKHARHWERTTQMHLKPHLNCFAFLTALICLCHCVWKFLSVSDRNHTNTSKIYFIGLV